MGKDAWFWKEQMLPLGITDVLGILRCVCCFLQSRRGKLTWREHWFWCQASVLVTLHFGQLAKCHSFSSSVDQGGIWTILPFTDDLSMQIANLSFCHKSVWIPMTTWVSRCLVTDVQVKKRAPWCLGLGLCRARLGGGKRARGWLAIGQIRTHGERRVWGASWVWIVLSCYIYLSFMSSRLFLPKN